MARRSIPSVLAQTYQNWELVVVSDGLHNVAVARAVQEFGDHRIHYHEICRPDYSGLDARARWFVAGAAARNRAEELAQGDLIALLDDDDEFFPNHLFDCVNALDETGADLCYGRVVLADANLGRHQSDYLDWSESETRRLFVEENVIYTPSVVYSAAWRHIPYPDDGAVAADHGKWLAMRDAGARFTSVPAPQGIYHGDALTGQIRISTPSLPPTSDLCAAVERIAETRYVSNYGPHCRELERSLAEYLDTAAVVAVASGDTALGMAMTVIRERRPGRNEVIVPSYTFPSTVNAILRAGLTPIFCDVDPLSLGVTVNTVAKLIGSSTAAVVPVHSHGIPCDMPGLERLCEAHGLMLVSDAAAALGGRIGERRVGSFGDMEVFSFSATKVLTCGEGGAIACRDADVEQQLRKLGRYGLGEHYECHYPAGVNGRLSEFAAAVGLAGLEYLDFWLARRTDSAGLYAKLLADDERLRLIAPSDNAVAPTWKDISVLTPSVSTTKRLAARLADYRIETRPYYRPLHRMRAYADVPCDDLVVTDSVADRLLSLPISNEIPDSTVQFVSEVLLAELDDLIGPAT
ncbi:MAG: DegT/DnrJ/EryC1/StrS family aminotransferase [Actinomycetota bacterium]|nr:DegT/DnrJ/EryC1/StrS family aminotransferase [Actinomycetota bacterium]